MKPNKLLLILSLTFLAACADKQPIPKAYMPQAPEILMKAPLELQTIKNGEDNAK
jgi:hypothetical protein